MRLARLLNPAKKALVFRVSRVYSAPQAPARGAVAVTEAVRVPDMKEKRRFRRFSKDFKIDLLDGADRPAGQPVQLMDMSPYGLGIECHDALAVGQTLGFRLSVQGSGVVEARARVRWMRPAGFRKAYGLEIEGLNFLTRRSIETCLDPNVRGLGLSEILTLALQAASTLMALYVLCDWMRGNPEAITGLLMMAPYILLVGVTAFVAWAMPRS